MYSSSHVCPAEVLPCPCKALSCAGCSCMFSSSTNHVLRQICTTWLLSVIAFRSLAHLLISLGRNCFRPMLHNLRWRVPLAQLLPPSIPRFLIGYFASYSSGKIVAVRLFNVSHWAIRLIFYTGQSFSSNAARCFIGQLLWRSSWNFFPETIYTLPPSPSSSAFSLPFIFSFLNFDQLTLINPL